MLGIPEPKVEQVELTSADRARVIGVYEIRDVGPEPLRMHVFEDAGKLRVQADGQVAATLIFQGNDTFVLDLDPKVQLVFARGDHAPSFTLHQGGMSLEAPRVQ